METSSAENTTSCVDEEASSLHTTRVFTQAAPEVRGCYDGLRCRNAMTESLWHWVRRAPSSHRVAHAGLSATTHPLSQQAASAAASLPGGWCVSVSRELHNESIRQF
jgi:hypothetical protein